MEEWKTRECCQLGNSAIEAWLCCDFSWNESVDKRHDQLRLSMDLLRDILWHNLRIMQNVLHWSITKQCNNGLATSN